MAGLALLMLLGVALIDGKLWKMMAEQRRHNRSVEQLLSEIRDRRASHEAPDVRTGE